MKNIKYSLIINSILILLLFAFLGAVQEYFVGLLLSGQGIFYSKSLYLLFNIKIPFLPIYGFGGLFFIMLQKLMDKGKVKYITRGFLGGLFLIGFELISGIISYAIFNQRLWDYSTHLFNLFGIISFQVALLWMFYSFILSKLYLILDKKV